VACGRARLGGAQAKLAERQEAAAGQGADDQHQADEVDQVVEGTGGHG
jgi:hypothetical protein